MSWIVPWNGKDYDVDPYEFTGLELTAIKQRTGLSLKALIPAITDLDGDATRVLFWTVERRTEEVKFTEYSGPPSSVILPHLNGLSDAMEALGKLMPQASESSGSDSSASSTESDLPNIEL